MDKRSRTKKQPPLTVVPVESGKVIIEATGTEDPHLQQLLINQVYDALWLPESLSEDDRTARIQSAISMLRGISPTDEVEGMLATRMVATHNAVMECLRRAMIPAQSYEGRDQNLKHATKLLSICSRQIEVLDKHRGKGQQKVTVEYVNVETGGQAIVGNVEGGKANGRPRKGGKSKTQAIPDNPGEPMKLNLKDGQTKSRQES